MHKDLKKDYILSLVSGSEKGTSYKIVSNEITLGRGTFCDVTLKGDYNISRKHAKISISPDSPDSIKIENLSSKASILINGGKIFHFGHLKDKDIFQLGKTKLQIRVLSPSSSHLRAKGSSASPPSSPPQASSKNRLAKNSKEALPMTNTPSAPVPPSTLSEMPSNSPPSLASTSSKPSSLSLLKEDKNALPDRQKPHQEDSFKTFFSPQKGIKKKVKFYSILALFFIGFIIFMSSENEPNLTQNMKILTQKEIDLKIEAHRKLAQAIDESNNKKGKNTFQYKEAQIHYLQGFRDYKKGQYKRAMTSFQTCLSLFQNHEMCKRYFLLAKKKLGELIQYYMIQGKKYRDRYQFSACQVAFRNVMIMVQNRNSPFYKEARGNYLICKKRWNHRF